MKNKISEPTSNLYYYIPKTIRWSYNIYGEMHRNCVQTLLELNSITNDFIRLISGEHVSRYKNWPKKFF